MTDQASGLLSPWLRKRRQEKARPYIRGRVLDYGCGIGTLSEMCRPETYLGVDVDEWSIDVARKAYPRFRFDTDLPETGKFDTIVALAVIEHIPDPAALLEKFESRLGTEGRIVLTTPHPSVEYVHDLGARIGLFSAHASEEHERLIDYGLMKELLAKAGLVIEKHERFLLGANQLFVLRRR
jgi:2-polyprenyl-3-methyl-5-hydroxy-6-metoxy-1,4-benzoquinol methylase